MLLSYADLVLALGILLGVMLMSIGSVKHSLGLEVFGAVLAVLCLVAALYWFWG